MIKSLRLRNFQRHKTTLIRFKPGVTIIHGPTDAGKSSLIRALRWVFLNDAPTKSPDGFFLWGSKMGLAEAEVDDHKITRRRKIGGRNSYLLDGKRYDAVRVQVPDPIRNIAQISETNFQDQHSAAFWLSDSPGSVSRQLNQIINLEEIDTSLAKAAARVRTTKAEADVFKSRVTSSKKALGSLAWTEDAEVALLELEEREQSISKLAREIAELESAVKRVEKLERELREAATLLQAFDELKNTASSAERTQQELEGLQATYTRLERIESRDPELMAAFEALRELSASTTELKTEWRELGVLVLSVSEREEELCEAESQLKLLTRRLKSLGRKVCPKCGLPLSR